MSQVMKQILMPDLQKSLDAESYEWLAERSPRMVKAIEAEVMNGRTPEQIRLYVLLHTGRPEIAMRCQQVSRHILNSQAE